MTTLINVLSIVSVLSVTSALAFPNDYHGNLLIFTILTLNVHIPSLFPFLFATAIVCLTQSSSITEILTSVVGMIVSLSFDWGEFTGISIYAVGSVCAMHHLFWALMTNNFNHNKTYWFFAILLYQVTLPFCLEFKEI